MKKILYVTHLSGKRVNRFWISSIKAAHELGMEFHLACNMSGADEEHWKTECEEYGIITHQIDFVRSPYSLRNIKAYQQMKKLLSDQNFEIIHCNTPIGGVVTRLAAHAVKARKVIYQAHGFHFWKGAPFVNWSIYYPVERFLARWTDVLVTINQEDYRRGMKFSAKKVCYIPGVGIDTRAFCRSEEEKQVRRRAIREEFRIPADATILLSVGELIPRKNHRVVIEALARVKQTDMYYIVCGRGPLLDTYRELTHSLGIDDRVIFPGFRVNISDFFCACDIFVFPSLQEGLPVALMEAMGAGLPVACSKIRGNTDLIEDRVTGYYIKDNASDIVEKIEYMVDHPEERYSYAQKAFEKLRMFGLDNVVAEMRSIYSKM